MIEVAVNLTHATPDEVEAFYALAGVGRAIDAIVHSGRQAGVRLVLLNPEPPEADAARQALRLDPVH